MRWRLLAVACLALTAGCGTFATGSDPTPTVTPAPVPALPTTTATASGPAPGLSGGGVTDVDRLAAAHRQALDETAYVWKAERRVDRLPDRAGDEHAVRQRLVVASERRYRYETNRRDVHSRGDERFLGDVTEFADGETVYRRFVPFGDRSFTYDSGPAEPVSEAYAREVTRPIRQYLAVPNATVAEVRVDEGTYYRVDARRTDILGLTRGHNVSVTALVSPRGFVRSMNVTYDVDRGNRVERVRYRSAYERRDAVAIERPDWVRERWGDDGRDTPALARSPLRRNR